MNPLRISFKYSSEIAPPFPTTGRHFTLIDRPYKQYCRPATQQMSALHKRPGVLDPGYYLRMAQNTLTEARDQWLYYHFDQGDAALPLEGFQGNRAHR